MNSIRLFVGVLAFSSPAIAAGDGPNWTGYGFHLLNLFILLFVIIGCGKMIKASVSIGQNAFRPISKNPTRCERPLKIALTNSRPDSLTWRVKFKECGTKQLLLPSGGRFDSQASRRGRSPDPRGSRTNHSKRDRQSPTGTAKTRSNLP